MRENKMEQTKLFQWINMVSFAAIAYFNHFREVRTKALKEYENNYGPLTLDTAKPDQMWLWSTQPMPWEGGYC